MPSMNVIRELTLRVQQEGSAQVEAALDRVTAAEGRLTDGASKMASAMDLQRNGLTSTSRQWNQQRAHVDEAFRGQQRYDRLVRTGQQALQASKITHEEYNRTLDLAARKYRLVEKANDNVANSFQLAGHQVQNLRYQLADVAQSLAGGMSPFQVLMQQGSQIAGVFGPGQGGVLGILRGIGQAIPRSVAIGGGLLGLGGTFATAYAQSQREGAEENRALRGVGLRSGLNRQELDRLVSGPQGLGVGDLSLAESRSVGLSMAGAGLGAEAITRGLLGARNMSAALNISLDETTKLLTDFGHDPVKSYDGLARATGYANAETRRYISSLAEQGESDKALVVTLDAITRRLGTYGENTTTVDRALTRLGNVGSNMWSLFKRDVDAATDASGKHGAAVKSASEVAIDAVERERKKVEERNAAYRLRSDDLIASMGIDNRIAGLDPLRQAVIAAQRSAGVGPALSKAEEDARRGESRAQRDLRQSLEQRIEEQVTIRNTIELKRALTEQSRSSTATLEMEIGAVGRAASEIDRLRYATQARIAAGQGGRAISSEIAAQIEREAAAYAKLNEELRRAQLADQIRFDRSQINRSPADQAIAAQLRPLGGIDDPRNAGTVRQLRELEEMRRARSEAIQALDELRSGSRGITTGLFSDLRQGKNPTDNILSSIGRMTDQWFDRTVSRPLIEGMMGRDGTGQGGWLTQGFGGLKNLFGGAENPLTPIFGTVSGLVIANDDASDEAVAA